MAEVKVDPKYREFANQLVAICRDRGVILSDYAEGLLRLAAEAWFEEPPRFRSPRELSRSESERLATQILIKALEDPHINRKSKAQSAMRGRVNFHDLLWSLSNSGKSILDEILDKGF